MKFVQKQATPVQGCTGEAQMNMDVNLRRLPEAYIFLSNFQCPLQLFLVSKSSEQRLVLYIFIFSCLFVIIIMHMEKCCQIAIEMLQTRTVILQRNRAHSIILSRSKKYKLCC